MTKPTKPDMEVRAFINAARTIQVIVWPSRTTEDGKIIPAQAEVQLRRTVSHEWSTPAYLHEERI